MATYDNPTAVSFPAHALYHDAERRTRHFTITLPDPVVTDGLTEEEVLRFADPPGMCLPISCDDMSGGGGTCNVSKQLDF
jgi:hypothetical protein